MRLRVDNGRPHVLVVAYAFPPAAPIGTMRPLRVVRALDREGWSSTVLMASPESYRPDMPMDSALLSRVPAGVEVSHAPVWRPIDAFAGLLVPPGQVPVAKSTAPAETQSVGAPPGPIGKLRRFLKDLTSIPDVEVGWVVPAVAKGLLAIRRARPRVIYSTAPPWTGQLVALLLARVSRLPWVADFRDPWARAPWRESMSPMARKAAAMFERAVIARADAVIFATNTNRDDYAACYGAQAATRFFVVPNGCDPDEFVDITSAKPEEDFVIVHAGSLYGARTPEPLLSALASAIDKGHVRKDQVRLRLIGATPDARLQAVAESLGLERTLEFVPRMPRRAVLQEMASASALLALQPATTVSIPGKLYEYVALGKPILAICEEGETADLVRRSGLGVAVTTSDAAAVAAGLLQVMELARGPLRPASPDLYDGNRSAATAVAIITKTSEFNKRAPSATATPREARQWRV